MTDGSWFSANRSTVKRSEGRNAVACAAYVAGAKLYDATERTTHDYTRKQGVVESFVTTPFGKDGLEWAHDIERLSTAMESHEKRKDAQVAHQWRIALPDALDDEGREALTLAAAQKLSDLYGVAVIAGIHRPDEKGDDRNHHAHLLFTTRTVEAEGKLGAKVTSITSPKTSDAEVSRYREIVADLINDALEEAGSDERVSHLSYAARGIEKIPTIHLGPAASGLERKGIGSDRGDINREILDAREAIEARLVWQQEQAQPEIDASIQRDLAQRFGDDFAEVLKEARAGEPLPGIEEHAMQDAEPLHEDPASGGSTDMLAAPRGWRERMKALASHAMELIHDQTSGAPVQQPEPEAQPHAEPGSHPSHGPRPSPGPRSWVSRVMEAGRHMLHGRQRHDSEATPAMPVRGIEPPSKPLSAFERLMLERGGQSPASEPEAGAQPPTQPDPVGGTALGRFTAAYERALRDQPGKDELEGLERYRASFNADPEPDQPKPEPKAPGQDYGPEL